MTHRPPDSQPPSPFCAAGEGQPPRYVRQICSSGGLITIKVVDHEHEHTIECENDEQLIAHCSSLAKLGVPFSTGGRMPGPAEYLAEWQADGRLDHSFLEISWRNQSEWMLYEIVPGAMQWEKTTARELMHQPPRRFR